MLSRNEEGDLSKFIEEAVKWRVLDQTEVRGKIADMSPEALESVICEAVAAARQPPKVE